MAWPAPEPGLVISYDYLWHEEAADGLENGLKNRPCVIVVAVAQQVLVAPITHSPPRDDQPHLPLPPKVKSHLGLDADQSWIVTDQLNRFTWPGHDVRPRPDDPDRIDYGFLPPILFEQIKTAIAGNWAAGAGKTVKRS